MYCFYTRAESHCVDRLNGHARPPTEAANVDGRGGIADTVAKCRKLIQRRLRVRFHLRAWQGRGKPALPPFSGGGGKLFLSMTINDIYELLQPVVLIFGFGIGLIWWYIVLR